MRRKWRRCILGIYKFLGRKEAKMTNSHALLRLNFNPDGFSWWHKNKRNMFSDMLTTIKVQETKFQLSESTTDFVPNMLTQSASFQDQKPSFSF